MITRDEMIESFRGGLCRFSFTKKDGESRVMLGTLNFDSIPTDKHPKSDGNDKPVNTDVVKVYDTEKEGWRSFRVDSVNDFVAGV